VIDAVPRPRPTGWPPALWFPTNVLVGDGTK
jgi:hypothetical protein